MLSTSSRKGWTLFGVGLFSSAFGAALVYVGWFAVTGNWQIFGPLVGFTATASWSAYRGWQAARGQLPGFGEAEL